MVRILWQDALLLTSAWAPQTAMAATQVFSIDTSLLQSVSWSQDDRIAINSDKDIVVLAGDRSST